MRAQLLERIVSLRESDTPLTLVDLPLPEPGSGEVRIRVRACGVCHTELDEIEGRAAPPRLPVVPGHQVVGTVDALGPGVVTPTAGSRVGVGWIYHSRGGPEENIAPSFRATGRDANGGYAEFMVAPADYTHPIPEAFSDAEAAPLLCAGAIGYRALRMCGLRQGDRLGLTGFGGSAHLVLPTARHLYPESEVIVFARSSEAQAFARELGADWAGDFEDYGGEPLSAIIDTTPAWTPVVSSLARLAPGGRLVINAIRKEDGDREALLGLRYEEHLWMERQIKTVANITGADIHDFLEIAAAIALRPTYELYPLEEANRALVELSRGRVRGAKVLRIGTRD